MKIEHNGVTWQSAPALTTWGQSMMMLDLPIGKDATARVYVDRDDIPAFNALYSLARGGTDDGTRYKAAYDAWQDKTEWVQEWISAGKIPAQYLWMHRADVLRAMLERRPPHMYADHVPAMYADSIAGTVGYVDGWNDCRAQFAGEVPNVDTCADTHVLDGLTIEQWRVAANGHAARAASLEKALNDALAACGQLVDILKKAELCG